MGLKIILSTIFLILGVLGSYASAWSQAPKRMTPSFDGGIAAGPYYNPASKSYYELRRLPILIARTEQYSRKWSAINKFSQSLYLGKTQGRLATISNADTHYFLLP